MSFCRQKLVFASKWCALRNCNRRQLCLQACLRNIEKNARIEEVTIPTRIERDPTDILRALAGTLKKDYTAPHYKYHDDPFLIPASNVDKRTYALSKDSGRKAARYFLNKYPELFYRDDAEPKIAAYSYKDTVDENTEVGEEDLINCIEANQVFNAITVYNNCIKQERELSKDTVQALLELVCFYNSNDGPDDEFKEEDWFRRMDGTMKSTWKKASFAEELFRSISPKEAKAYCALIQGMAKYNSAADAYKYFEQAKELGLVLTVDTYNSILSIVPHLRESSESRNELICDILNEMAQQKVHPNINTFNEYLSVISRGSTWRQSKNTALRVLAEMKQIGLRPSLATYYFLLTIFCSERGPSSPILNDILEDIGKSQFTIQHPYDTRFFVKAMDVCNNHLSDVGLAYKVHELYQRDGNQKFMENSHTESVYYQNFFRVLASGETMENVMDFYDKYVPNIYTPEPTVMEKLLGAVEFYSAFHYIPQLWTDMVTFDHHHREKLVATLLRVMAKEKQPDELQQQFVEIAQSVITKVDELSIPSKIKLTYKPVTWSGDMLSDCIAIFLNGNDLERAFSVLKKLESDQSQIMGFAVTAVLEQFCSKCLDEGALSKLNFCVKYASEMGNTDVVKFVAENANRLPEHARQALEERLSNSSSLSSLKEDVKE